MGDEEIIPLNDELATTAKIMDMSDIRDNYSLVSIALVLKMESSDDLIKKYENDKPLITNLIGVLTYYGDLELMTPEFRDLANSTLAVLNRFKDGILLTDADVTILKTNLSSIYNDLVSFGSEHIGLHKSITFSLVDGELEKALAKISGYPYANIAKINSLLFKNVNSLLYTARLMYNIVTTVNTKIAQVDVMIDMASVSESYTRGEITRFLSDLNFNITKPVHNFMNNKYVDMVSDTQLPIEEVLVTATDNEILNAINYSRESIKSIYNTLRVDTMLNVYNTDLNKIDLINGASTVYMDADFKENVFKIKCLIDMLTELVCSTTDAINSSIEKLKLSIPVSANEIDDIDTI